MGSLTVGGSKHWKTAFVLTGLLLGSMAVASPPAAEAAPAAAPKAASAASSGSANKASASKKRRTTRRRRARRPLGQQAMERKRIVEIQQALINAGYLDGKPSGVWDDRSKQAMTRFQKDNGWQTKITPDSRALIKLGLGPNYSNVLNPEAIVADETRAGGGTAESLSGAQQ